MKSFRLNINLILITLLVVLLYTIWTFYIPLLDNYFYGDDTQVIWFAATKSIGQILFSSEDYRLLSGGLFQPMLALSFKIDWMMFKMAPNGYYIHNLVAVMLAGAALFIFLRVYTDNLTAFIGFVLFSLNPVVFSVFNYCTNRHYMEGMAFALLSLYFFVRSDRRGKISILSAIFYLLAALYKEVYVLLPAIALIISRGNILQRLKSTLFMWVVLFLYIMWRFWMIGGIGGYPFYDIWEFKNLTSGINNLLKKMPFHFFGSYHILFWPVITIILITTNRKRDILKLGIILIILLIPTLPVLRLYDTHFTWCRYIFHLSVFLIFIGVLWGRENLIRRGWRGTAVIAVLITVVTLSIIRNYELKTSFHNEMKVSKETTEEFLYSGKEYIKGKQPAWFYEGLRDINKYCYGKKIDTKIIPENELIDYMSRERRLEIISLGYDIKPEPGKELRRNIIKGKLKIFGYRMNWEFGPYKTGYFIVGGSHKGLYTTIMPLKSRGEYLFGKHYPDGRLNTNFIRMVYKSPEGWEGITDEFKIGIPGNESIILQ
jgi:hypothetical protein